MTERRRSVNREDLLLTAVAVLLGLAIAAAYGAYRAVALDGEDTAARLGEFAGNLLWPGALIAAAVAAVVWFGWKANID